MKLSELTLPSAYEECKNLSLVYGRDVAVALYAIQQEHGDPRHVVTGQLLEDGQYMIAGEVLSEVGEGGIFAWIAEYLSPELMAQVEVVSPDAPPSVEPE
jgi:hypothetical protein